VAAFGSGWMSDKILGYGVTCSYCVIACLVSEGVGVSALIV